MTPQRIQRHRTKGWRTPQNTVIVTRPSVFGNPFKVGAAIEAGYEDGHSMAVWAFEQWLNGSPDFNDKHIEQRAKLLKRLPELRGKNLCCYCPPDKKCHAEVLLRIANAPEIETL